MNDQKCVDVLDKILDKHTILGSEVLGFISLKKWLRDLPNRLNPIVVEAPKVEVSPVIEETPKKVSKKGK